MGREGFTGGGRVPADNSDCSRAGKGGQKVTQDHDSYMYVSLLSREEILEYQKQGALSHFVVSYSREGGDIKYVQVSFSSFFSAIQFHENDNRVCCKFIISTG